MVAANAKELGKYEAIEKTNIQWGTGSIVDEANGLNGYSLEL